ncbi:2-octaprenyl-6-methoxyphenol hydroxylase [Oceanospirillum multiglobuliferum]|uniref:2-octaprenyl-6-methoxyphenyl hydroxylase n=1 Tax=Oceanospirillum multiglobuliferum TaxID=64969 RepID=A0A1T4SDC3_9GAMM|nr:2-octaprenyl-6-methoxyphenyl hydroxylase [Oceanospirillum multiglobuliferum]OPX54334.1 2-octaprenyl-6-methoxyphenyl hydroxylase [Oceanospirillum multiglobuliferum]SKA26222.1 2-octaprenyl-6-methoxyphenol hydroxylase [Oceanospirillum multiglobuliferum]
MSTATHDNLEQFDIAIIGGGLVGASLACALEGFARQHQWSIAVIEAVPMPEITEGETPESFQPSYDARSTALSWGTKQIYDQLGLWSQLAPHAAPIKKIHVSDQGHLGATRLNAQDHHVDALGYVAPNQWLGRVLLQAVQQAQHLFWFCPFTVERMDVGAGEHLLHLNDSQGLSRQIAAKLVVLADGGQSNLKQQLQIVDRQQPYEQNALVCNLTLSQPHQNEAFERFTPSGPMAWLPLTAPKDIALVWTVPTDEIETVMALTDAEFAQRLHKLFGYRLGAVEKVGQRYQYPLTLVRATEQIRPGLVVLGNAAHYMHPVAGQGYNLALRGVADLADTLNKAALAHQPLGDLAVLQGYLAGRQADQDSVIGFSDGLIRLFANHNPVLGHLRAGGLMLLDRLTPAKRWFARQAMGIGGQAVRLQPVQLASSVPVDPRTSASQPT